MTTLGSNTFAGPLVDLDNSAAIFDCIGFDWGGSFFSADGAPESGSFFGDLNSALTDFLHSRILLFFTLTRVSLELGEDGKDLVDFSSLGWMFGLGLIQLDFNISDFGEILGSLLDFVGSLVDSFLKLYDELIEIILDFSLCTARTSLGGPDLTTDCLSVPPGGG
jgi:hypothetical protein